jgi:hypothetical protein
MIHSCILLRHVDFAYLCKDVQHVWPGGLNWRTPFYEKVSFASFLISVVTAAGTHEVDIAVKGKRKGKA